MNYMNIVAIMNKYIENLYKNIILYKFYINFCKLVNSLTVLTPNTSLLLLQTI